METRILGGDLEVSAVGLGCMGMSHAYGAPADREDMRNLIAEAVDLGVRFFDTAELYGNKDEPNANEELLGELLAPYRDKIVIGTKFGVRFDYDSSETNLPVIPDARPEVIRKSVEGSLRRLRTDHIDLYYQHRRDPSVPVEEVAGGIGGFFSGGKN